MNEYKPNSHKSKEKAKAGAKKPVKKESKLAKIFTADDLQNVKSYVIYDILIPKVRETIDKMITETSHLLFLGGSTATSSDSSGRSYTKYYRGSDRESRSTYNRSAHDVRTPKFSHEIDANDVLDQLSEVLDRCGMVRVADLYDLMGWKFNHTDNNYGWHDLRTARIVRDIDHDVYILKLPRVVCL